MLTNFGKFCFSRVVTFGMKNGWADKAKLTNNFLKVVVTKWLKNSAYYR
jgi:hypothetical protein